MNNEIISFTTRAKRSGEVDGEDYLYISEEEFRRLYDKGEIVESTTYYGRANYGITLQELEYKLSKGPAFVIVDVEGKKQLEEFYKDTVSIFFNVSQSNAELRMRSRGDAPETIASRLETIEEESNNFFLYDYIVDANQSKEDVIRSIHFILTLEGIASCM
ncbi:Guanylate kinase [compost metagenome]